MSPEQAAANFADARLGLLIAAHRGVANADHRQRLQFARTDAEAAGADLLSALDAAELQFFAYVAAETTS
ncbi:hypothetical protein IVB36_22585 [Bradyrhizobium sp. 35]|uniref:hypothetical protein n=1 Tax=Bradyrhizobium sp. 35 TaxID=2782670 RepID=UPI001FF803E1|nr:hypothetical protein [Bradyrhizobium sp. 35]MCK1453583.1 hypothetical protein [Bradyrhizobium sp. 35]